MTAPVKPRRTRKPTGIPPWPTILLAGGEKSGKSWSAAQFSGSELVGQTFYIEIGEHYADEYGRIPGARYEIVEHDGTYGDILEAVRWAVAQPKVDGKPNCIIADSVTILWDMLVDQAHATAYRRWRNKYPKAPEPTEEVQVTIDLWNIAKAKFAAVIGELYRHDGPSILTARLEQVAIVSGGKPTNEKAWKVRAEKNLPFEVDAVIQAREPRTFQITGLRSTVFQLPAGETIPMPGFTVEGFLRNLGLDKAGATAPRSVTLPASEPEPTPPRHEGPEEAAPPPGIASPADVRLLNIRFKEKFGPLSDKERLERICGFIRRAITSTSQVRTTECAAMLHSLAQLPNYSPEPVPAPAPAPVPLSIQQAEDPETIAAAQSLLPLVEADEADRVESSLRDLLESAGSPDDLEKAWKAVEARQAEQAIGAVHVMALRSAYEVRKAGLWTEAQQARRQAAERELVGAGARQPQEAGV